MGDHRRFTELQIHNVALKLQQEGFGKVAPKPLMVEKSSNTMDYSLLEPSISTVPVVPGLELVVGKFLADDVCAKFWEIESKISLSFNLHQFYEIHQNLFLAMT